MLCSPHEFRNLAIFLNANNPALPGASTLALARNAISDLAVRHSSLLRRGRCANPRLSTTVKLQGLSENKAESQTNQTNLDSFSRVDCFNFANLESGEANGEGILLLPKTLQGIFNSKDACENIHQEVEANYKANDLLRYFSRKNSKKAPLQQEHLIRRNVYCSCKPFPFGCINIGKIIFLRQEINSELLIIHLNFSQLFRKDSAIRLIDLTLFTV